MKKYKLLIFTDSLGLPRESPEVVKINESWVELLKSDFEVRVFSFGGGTVSQLFSQVVYHEVYNPDFVIIQSGIVDCAPRALKTCELEFVKKYRLLSRFFQSKKVINFLRTKRRISYTSKKDFLKNVKKFKNKFSDKLFWVGIMPVGEDYEARLPGVKKKVEDYNDLIKSELKSNFISTVNFSSSFLMSDGIHLNVDGNRKLSEKICLKIKENQNEKK